jgi:hypothetical protein
MSIPKPVTQSDLSLEPCTGGYRVRFDVSPTYGKSYYWGVLGEPLDYVSYGFCETDSVVIKDHAAAIVLLDALRKNVILRVASQTAIDNLNAEVCTLNKLLDQSIASHKADRSLAESLAKIGTRLDDLKQRIEANGVRHD